MPPAPAPAHPGLRKQGGAPHLRGQCNTLRRYVTHNTMGVGFINNSRGQLVLHQPHPSPGPEEGLGLQFRIRLDGILKAAHCIG